MSVYWLVPTMHACIVGACCNNKFWIKNKVLIKLVPTFYNGVVFLEAHLTHQLLVLIVGLLWCTVAVEVETVHTIGGRIFVVVATM